MKRILACLAALALSAIAFGAQAQSANPATDQTQAQASAQSTPAAQPADPIGDLLAAQAPSLATDGSGWTLRATLYHGGGAMRAHDSLGCRVSPMRTVAVDPAVVSRRSIIFIKETVGMPLDGGGVHDGYWYASDIGGAIKGDRIDLFTGAGAGSMHALQPLNLKTVTVTKVGDFSGCPPIDGGGGMRVADAR